MAHKITEIGAWIAAEPDGTEGIVAMLSGDTMMPLIGSDYARIESLRPHAEAISKLTNRPVALKRFKLVEETEDD
jgi:hypothetical protein